MFWCIPAWQAAWPVLILSVALIILFCLLHLTSIHVPLVQWHNTFSRESLCSFLWDVHYCFTEYSCYATELSTNIQRSVTYVWEWSYVWSVRFSYAEYQLCNYLLLIILEWDIWNSSVLLFVEEYANGKSHKCIYGLFLLCSEGCTFVLMENSLIL